jgi:DNA-binding CsgD family transcriptional regulator
MVVGDVAGARGLITELAGRAEAYPDLDPIVAGHLRGLLALNEGDTEEAATHLWNAYTHARDSGIHEPGRRQHLEGDLGRALVAVGRLDDAAELAKELLALGERSGRPLVLGVGLRIHGLVQAERGDLNQATETLRRAVAAHEQAPVPLALGRTLIAYGQVCRRQPKRRAEGVQALQRAVDCFTEMGATALVDRAQAELDRGQRTRTGALLTAAEQQVAELVAGGATNREAAARLFTSVRTVEGHLAVVYRKVGVRSRTELAKRYNAGGVDG